MKSERTTQSYAAVRDPRRGHPRRVSWILPGPQRIPTHKRHTGRAGTTVDLLLLHYAVDPEQRRTWDALDVARGFARHDERTASAHFVVGRDGSLVQCVDVEDTAWHAGTSRKSGPSRFPEFASGTLAATPAVRGSVNRRSVGVEICNVGWAVDPFRIQPENLEAGLRHRNPRSTSKRWESYRPDQIIALEGLVAELRKAAPTLRWVCGHEDVAHYDVTGKGSKLDPGPAFPWGAIDWCAHGLTRIVYDFAAKAWVEASDETTKPLHVPRLA